MIELIDLISIADEIASTNPSVKKLKIGQKTNVHSAKLQSKYPVLSKLDLNLISITRNSEGIYGTTMQLWEVDGSTNLVETNGNTVDPDRYEIISILVGRSTGIATLKIDGINLKITANLSDDCLLEFHPKDGKLNELNLENLTEYLKERPDNFTKLNNEILPLNTPIKIVQVSGTTKKYQSQVYKVSFSLNGKKQEIDRLLPDSRLRYLIENGTDTFYIGNRYEKIDKLTGEKNIKVKIFDSKNPKLDDIELLEDENG